MVKYMREGTPGGSMDSTSSFVSNLEDEKNNNTSSAFQEEAKLWLFAPYRDLYSTVMQGWGFGVYTKPL